MFQTVLVANRGEIACRVIRTLRRMGIRSVAVYSDADADARHVALADAAVRLGAASAADSYLNIPAVIAAASATGAEAIHPGYGFLAENASFAEACEAAGIVFIGPSVEAIRVMGDKISARRAVEARGVPTVPGAAAPGMTDAELEDAAGRVGFPLLVKPSAGGGGKGMHVVESAAELPEALAAARREAAGAFGDDTLFLERYVSSPRHIEIQVLADAAGNVVHLGERDCTLQRRHQKVIEEAPSPIIDDDTRSRLGEAACQTARSVGYTGAGTVEFIVSGERPEEFFFMEMNTRLQVEHPVTELVTGVDLVEQQLRVAAGLPLPFRQEELRLNGHAVEARVYAEDPRAGFLPTGGEVLLLREPGGDGVRVDSGLAPGASVSSDYDPMLAKVIAWAPSRAEALARLEAALRSTTILGVTSNVEFLTLLLGLPEVQAGTMDTELIGRALPALPFAEPTAEILADIALALFEQQWERSGPAPWHIPSGWRLGPAAPSVYRVVLEGHDGEHELRLSGVPSQAHVSIDGGEAIAASVRKAGADPDALLVELGGVRRTIVHAAIPDGIEVFRDGLSWRAREVVRRRGGPGDAEAAPEVTAPMPGTVVAVHARTGDTVGEGQPLLVVEAMKMEHVLRAPTAGTVTVEVSIGDRVARGQALAAVAIAAAEPRGTYAAAQTAAETEETRA